MACRDDTIDSVRIDKWLWAARFYKLRRIAAEAVKAGHVELNGARAKPARNVHIGDAVRIEKQQTVYEIVVRDLSAVRGPAPAARLLYEETAASMAAREEQAGARRLQAANSPAPKKRPDKRDRRHIIRFKSKE